MTEIILQRFVDLNFLFDELEFRLNNIIYLIVIINSFKYDSIENDSG